MQVKSIVLLSLPLALAAPAPQPAVESEPTLATFSGYKTTAMVPRGEIAPEAADLEKRQDPITAIVTTIAVTAATKLTEAAVDAAVKLIGNIASFDSAREAFTQATVKDMWGRNPDPAKYHAAICYNKGYRVENPAGTTGLVSAKLTQGPLNTDYDCMYMDAPNAFFTDSDGGFINLAYFFDNRCTHDRATGDLRCI